MAKVIVASKNPVKIKCVENVFSKYFQNIKVIGKDIDSLVSDQPKSEKEIIQGAKNRAEQIFKKYNPDFGIGIEAGLEYIENEPYSFSWICIRSKDAKIGLGRTAGYRLPPKIEELIKKGKELGEAGDIVFGIQNSKQKMGMIGLLSKEKLDRTKFYEHGVICALLPFLNKKLFDK